MLPLIAISIGDINGIGPEIVLKAFHRSDLLDNCRPVIYGPEDVILFYSQRLGMDVPLQRLTAPGEAREGSVGYVVTQGALRQEDIGRPTAESGRISLDAIRAAFDAAHSGAAQALVTAPISKEAIALAGSPFHGHTDMLAAFCESGENVLMILSSNTMNVGLVTIHVPLREVAALITQERVARTVRLAHRAMEVDFAIDDPRIAVLGLNPHAGDGGVIGAEEAEIIQPAVAALQEEGLNVEGPFPADGFFSAHTQQFYDIIIAMYHDQGLIPLKLQAMGRGVNITSGLPVVRTSPDHGTAYNIAGHGLASPESMKEAVHFARSIASNRLQ
ncbi:MAG: 4-hydroxythreonine-4-phosphate dehydrogenase PdxA [Bacteroidota bacterium]|nr:4-hydroxythreonine-4-phosphate dehydrogenase PdxA [Bacteroidota bacterium]